jgi:hypothetical protein
MFYRHKTDQGDTLYNAFLNFEKANISKYGSLDKQPVLEELF